MAKKKKAAKTAKKTDQRQGFFRRMFKWGVRLVLLAVVLVLCLVLAFRFVNPPFTHTMWAEHQRLGSYKFEWVDIEQVAPILPAALVAAEDARFCKHTGFDIEAIRAVIAEGARRGASTISQQTAKNVFLWQERGWGRKALEAGFTLLIELFWSKERILEVYMNVAEFDEGVFGIEAAAKHHFGVSAAKLSGQQAAALAAVLPNPKDRSAIAPSAAMKRRAASILGGARTIQSDGRDACFKGEP